MILAASIFAVASLSSLVHSAIRSRRKDFGIRIALGADVATLRQDITIHYFLVAGAAFGGIVCLVATVLVSWRATAGLSRIDPAETLRER